jgi:predicted AlkP superfamily phosphohydrolase/phosphomutase
MDQGVMPFLRDFVADGVRATLRSVIPPLTPPAWTSLMTGMRPGEHGVFDFFQKEQPDSVYLRFASSHDVHCPTLWSLASECGLRSNVLNFPLMFPPPAFDGCLVPGGWMPWRQLRLGCRPAGLFDRLKRLPSFNPRELSHDMALEEKALEGCAAGEYIDWITLHTRRERRWSEILQYLMREEPADLTAVLFDGVDKLQHLCWRFLDRSLVPESPTPWEREVRNACERYFRELDGLIAEIVLQSGPEATVVFASDHGFGPTSDIFYVNAWLEQQGYLAWAGELGMQPDASHQVGINRIARHVIELDWERTVAYAATPSSQGIHIVRQKPDGTPGVPSEACGRLREELTDGLLRFRHPETGRPVVAEVWAREDVFTGPYRDHAPDLTVRLEDDGVVSILRSNSILSRRPAPAGTHRPEGIFLAGGPGLRRGAAVEELSILDVAPFVLHALGLAIPEGLSGRLPAQTFEPAELRRRPPRIADGRTPEGGPESGSTAPPEPEYDAEEQALVMNRLAALGYLE